MFNKLHNWIIFFPLILASLISLLLLLLLRFLPTVVPLFYSKPWGDKQLAPKRDLFIIPSLIAVMTLLNFLITRQLHQQQSFYKNALMTTSMIISLILAITFIKIVFIFILG